MMHIQLSLFEVNLYERSVTNPEEPPGRIEDVAPKVKYEQLVFDLFPKQVSEKKIAESMKKAA